MIHYFTDPVLAAPTIGSMLMCLIAAFVGTFSVLRKQSLVGETLSHASYPGIIISLLLAKMLVGGELLLLPLVGASVSALLGVWCINLLTKKYGVSSDSALCVVLSSFFGVALVLLSCLQSSFPTLYRELQSYLFGQAATQTNVHILLYSVLLVVVLGAILCSYRSIKTVIFDPEFAKTIGINSKFITALLLSVTVLAVVVGIRSLGVVLMSSMLIFPAVSGRLWTSRLEYVLLLAALFGMVAGFFGVYFSHELSIRQDTSFPTGPMIVVSAASIFIVSSFLSPEKGLAFRYVRRKQFRRLCRQENLLKVLWKVCSKKNSSLVSQDEIMEHIQAASLKRDLTALRKKGWVKACGSDMYELTPEGAHWGKKIVRLHRLWEVYLVEYCGVGSDRVHPSAEEMEHIITPDIELELEKLLDHPRQDPHMQPIPAREVNPLLP